MRLIAAAGIAPALYRLMGPAGILTPSTARDNFC